MVLPLPSAVCPSQVWSSFHYTDMLRCNLTFSELHICFLSDCGDSAAVASMHRRHWRVRQVSNGQQQGTGAIMESLPSSWCIGHCGQRLFPHLRSHYLLFQLLANSHTSHRCDRELQYCCLGFRGHTQYCLLHGMGEEGVRWTNHRDLVERSHLARATFHIMYIFKFNSAGVSSKVTMTRTDWLPLIREIFRTATAR